VFYAALGVLAVVGVFHQQLMQLIISIEFIGRKTNNGCQTRAFFRYSLFNLMVYKFWHIFKSLQPPWRCSPLAELLKLKPKT